MSIAPREAKWISPCTIWAGQERLGQRICTSPGGWTTGVSHAGQRSGMTNGRSSPVRSWVSGPTTWGMTSPARCTTTRSPIIRSLRATSSWLWRVARRDRRAADRHRLQHGERHQRAGAADADLDVVQRRDRRRRRELVGDRPARRAAHGAEALLDVDLVDLHHGAVDVEVHRRRGDPPTPRTPPAPPRWSSTSADVGVHAEARRRAASRGPPTGSAGRAPRRGRRRSTRSTAAARRWPPGRSGAGCRPRSCAGWRRSAGRRRRASR